MTRRGPRRDSARTPVASERDSALHERADGLKGGSVANPAESDAARLTHMPDLSSLPLAGVRVVDLSQIAAGPYSTSLLGDMGADVIKVEPPEGDSFRHLDDAFGTGQSGYFFGVNRSKRSIALDLKSQDGYAVLARLVSTADIVIVAFRPGALKRLRVDYDTLRERTGVGDKISISLFYWLIAAFANYITVYYQLRMPFRRQGGSHPQIVPY